MAVCNAAVYIFFLTILTVSGSLLNLTAKPSNTVMIGEKVILHCMVETVEQRTLKTNWMHHQNMVGENCDSFHDTYAARCPPGNQKYPPFYDFIIEKVRWEDRGNWSCYYGMNFSQLVINVTVPPIMKPHVVKTKIDDGVEPIGRLYDVKKVDVDVDGDGSRNRPYDLTGGQTISMACSTTCGYPKSDIMWMFSNNTSKGKIGEPKTIFKSNSCIGSKSGMFTQYSTFNSINCAKHKMVGMNTISCSLNLKEIKKSQKSNSAVIFILCPGGKQAPVLTYGEMIAIAVGAAIALILVFLNCFLFKESRRKAMRNRALTISSH